MADDEAYDRTVAAWDPAMVVVTTARGDERSGCLVGFHAQSSIEPRRHTVWLSKANRTYEVALEAEHLTVHALSVHDLDLARLFGTTSDDDVDKFTRCGPWRAVHDIPVLERCPSWFVGRRVDVVDDGGDHVAFVLVPVEAADGGPFEPLRLSAVTDLEPGHDATERRDPR